MSNIESKIKIFGSLEVESTEVLNNLIDNLSKEQSIFFLTESLKYAYNKGIFTLLESEILSKSLRKLYEPEGSKDN